MEDVLDVYARPLDPARPLVCVDEGGKELRAEIRPPHPPAPGQPATQDYEYVRQGSANRFLACAPHLGWRQVRVTARRTARDWAEAMRQLVDEVFPEAERLVLVLDNLNIHAVGSLYKAFPPAEAARIRRKLELHFTPTHGSWLNMAELELSALGRQCLERRLATPAALARETTAWTERRNAAQTRIAWRFTTAKAQVALPHLYPHLDHDISS